MGALPIGSVPPSSLRTRTAAATLARSVCASALRRAAALSLVACSVFVYAGARSAGAAVRAAFARSFSAWRSSASRTLLYAAFSGFLLLLMALKCRRRRLGQGVSSALAGAQEKNSLGPALPFFGFDDTHGRSA